MEYFELGDLHNFLKIPLVEDEARLITTQLLEGLIVMHEHKFTHRDLKPQVTLSTWFFKALENEDHAYPLNRISSSSNVRQIGGSRSVTLASQNGLSPILQPFEHKQALGTSKLRQLSVALERARRALSILTRLISGHSGTLRTRC